MYKSQYLLKGLALVLLVLTVIFIILPLEVAWIDMFFIVLMIGLLAIIVPESKIQFTYWAAILAMTFWLSKLIPGKVGVILSFSGIGFAFILAFFLVEKVEELKKSRKANKN